MTTKPSLKCHFCGKPQHEVRILIAGDHGDGLICDRCVERAVDHLDKARAKRRALRMTQGLPT